MTTSYSSRSAGVDILRIVSVVIVIASHYAIYPPFDVGGTRGVAIFFMVSGFCMAYSTHDRTGGQFLIARLVRLIPTLIICATITTVVEQTFPDARPDRLHSWSDYAYNVVCLPLGNLACDAFFQLKHGKPAEYLWVDGAYWSLLVELRFYILLWLLAYIIKIRRRGLLLALTACLAAVGAYIPWLSKGTDFFPYLSFFAFGLAVRAIYDREKWGSIAAVIAVASFALNSFISVPAPSLPLSALNFPGYAACFVIFVSVLHFARGWHSPLIGRIGVLTYPVYLVHQDIGLVLIAGLTPATGALGAKCLAVVAVVLLAIIVEELVSRMPWNNKRRQRPQNSAA